MTWILFSFVEIGEKKRLNSKKSTKAIGLRPDQHSPMLETVAVIYWFRVLSHRDEAVCLANYSVLVCVQSGNQIM